MSDTTIDEPAFQERRVPMLTLEQRVAKLEHDMQNLVSMMEDNTLITKQNAKDTKEVKEILELGRAFFTLARYFGILARWIIYVGGAIGGLWALFFHTPNPFGGDK